jgi:hypothetical protein
MQNFMDVKKKEGMGNQKHHRVLSTSTCGCDLEECLRPYNNPEQTIGLRNRVIFSDSLLSV